MESTSKIARMIHRILTRKLQDALRDYPAVALFGPRQSGKTTLALEVGKSFDVRYLDLESEQDRARLADPELYLFDQREHLVILDEVHRTPGLFSVLRGLIDKSRRAGRRSGLYLLLGSASLELLKQTGESLAGRISYIELTPFTILEAGAANADLLWTRGGFPDSMLASSGLLRFWTMLAWHQGGLVNMSQFSRSLGIDVKTVSNYMDLLVDLLLVRRLQPWHENAGKRLVRSPKVFIRDSGLTHALLGIADKDMLLSHPVAEQSWECFVIENLLDSAPADVQGYFYRTGGGAEIDLLLLWPDGKQWAVEVKRSLALKLERGFHSAHADLGPERSFVVYPGTERYRMSETVEAVSLADLAFELQQANNP